MTKTNILDFFKLKSKHTQLKTYQRAKDMCERMELEVIKAVVKNYTPGTLFTLKVLDDSDDLKELCMEMGKFCAMHVPDSSMQTLVLPTPVYLEDLDKHFDTVANPDLRVYALVSAPMFKAACNMVYGEYLRLIQVGGAELVTQRYSVYVSEAVDLCNAEAAQYHYKSYAPIIAVRKACIKLNTFIESLDKEKKDGFESIPYDATVMAVEEMNIMHRLETHV